MEVVDGTWRGGTGNATDRSLIHASSGGKYCEKDLFIDTY